MSVIDKKGKLFGKLNIIDLLAILLIVAVLALIGYKLTSNSGGLAGAGQKVIYTVEVKNVDAAVYESLQKEALPSQLTAANEMLDAYVTDIQGTPADPNAYHMQWDGSSGDLTLSQSQDGAYNVVFTIEGTVKDNLTSELGTQEIRVGQDPHRQDHHLRAGGWLHHQLRAPGRRGRRRLKRTQRRPLPPGAVCSFAKKAGKK